VENSSSHFIYLHGNEEVSEAMQVSLLSLKSNWDVLFCLLQRLIVIVLLPDIPRLKFSTNSFLVLGYALNPTLICCKSSTNHRRIAARGFSVSRQLRFLGNPVCKTRLCRGYYSGKFCFARCSKVPLVHFAECKFFFCFKATDVLLPSTK